MIVSGCTHRQNAQELIQRYISLHKAGKVDSLLLMHTEDTQFIFPGENPITGKRALRQLLEWDSVLHAELEMEGIFQKGDTIFVDTIVERSRFFKAMGISEIYYQSGTKIVLKNGLISQTYPAKFHQKSIEKISEQFSKVKQWLERNQPDLLNHLMPEGKIIQNAQTAKIWLEVLEKWQSSQKK